VSTVPVATIADVRSPAITSVAAAPGSVKADPPSTVRGLAPSSVITGGVASATSKINAVSSPHDTVKSIVAGVAVYPGGGTTCRW